MLIPSHQAIREGNLETLKACLAAGADINELEDGFSLLERACRESYFEIAKFLLDNDITIYWKPRINATVGKINNSQPLFEVVRAAKNLDEKLVETSNEQEKKALHERYEDCFKIFEMILRHEQIYRLKYPEKCKGIHILVRTYNEGLTPLDSINFKEEKIKSRFLAIYTKIQQEFPKPKQIKPEAEIETRVGLHKRQVDSKNKTTNPSKPTANAIDLVIKPKPLPNKPHSFWHTITSFFSDGPAEPLEVKQPLLNKYQKSN